MWVYAAIEKRNSGGKEAWKTIHVGGGLWGWDDDEGDWLLDGNLVSEFKISNARMMEITGLSKTSVIKAKKYLDGRIFDIDKEADYWFRHYMFRGARRVQ